jgi:ankyrin repeat protein
MARFVGGSLAGLTLLAGSFDDGQASSAPGMLVAPILPLLVPFLADGLAVMARRWRRWAVGLAMAWSVVVLVLVAERPRRLLAEPGHGVGRLPQQAMGWIAERRAPAVSIARRGFTVDHDGLLAAVRGGYVEAVGLFVEHGAATGDALLAAVQSGQPGSLARLVQDGASGPEAARALAWARHYERASLASILVDAGAAIDDQAPSGETALIVAVRLARTEERSVLLGQRADVNLAARNGETALMIAAQRGDLAAVNDLVAAGADLAARDLDHWTPLIYAARFGHTTVVQALLGSGAGPNARSRQGWTPLIWAAEGGFEPTAAALIAAGADVNASSHAGLTALIRAAGRGHAEMVSRLLTAGAHATMAVGGRDARAWAADAGHAAVLDALSRGRSAR